ncbi:MAG: MFS transporter [Thermoplasmatales archaeon]
MYRDILNDKKVARYITSYNSFYFANGFASTFLNVFFFSNGEILHVIEYQISYQLLQLLTFIISGTLSNRINTKHIYAYGNIFRAFSLMATIFIGGIFYNQVFFGAIYGLSGGLFWAGNAIVSLEVSRGKDRLNFLAVNSTVSYITSLLAPLVGGIAIEDTPLHGILRYSIVFTATAILLLFSAIEIEKLNLTERKAEKIRIIDSIYADRNIKRPFKNYFFFSSVYIFSVSIILPVFVFKVTGNYTLVGILAASMAASSICGNIFSPYLIKKRNTRIVYLYAVFIIASSFLYLKISSNPVLFSFIAGDVAMLFVAPINNRSMSNFMNSVDLLTTSFPYWINREYYLVGGRLVMLVSTIAIIFYFGFDILMHTMTLMAVTVLLMLSATRIDSLDDKHPDVNNERLKKDF